VVILFNSLVNEGSGSNEDLRRQVFITIKE
jgi:hypothetical protein